MAGGFRSERARSAGATPVAWVDEIKEGVRWLWQHRLLRSLAIILGILNALSMMAVSTYVFFVQLMTAGAAGGVVGSLVAVRVAARLGSGAALLTAIGMMTLQHAVTGLTSRALVVWAMFFVGTFWAVVWNVITVSLRQQVIPDDLLGRVNSVYRLFAWGMMPVGALAGGVIVTVTEALGSRSLALRMPFLVAAVVLVGVLAAARSHLNTQAVEAARAAGQRSPVADPSPTDPPGPATSGPATSGERSAPPDTPPGESGAPAPE